MVRRLRLSVRGAACAALLAGLCTHGDFIRRVGAERTGQSGEDVAPRAAVVDVVINNVALDTTAQDTQSGTTLVLGSGSSVIAAFNNSRLFSTGNNHFTGWSFSSDGGGTWTDGGALPDSTAGDVGFPVLGYDQVLARAYLATLCFTTSNCLQVFRSNDNGMTWSAPVNPAPGFGANDILDKPWLAVDNAPGPGQGTVYIMFRNFMGSGGRPNGIYMCRSTDGGNTWGPSGCLLLSTTGANGSWVTVGPDHSVYAFWYESSSIRMRRSIDLGQTFAPETTVTTLVSTAANGGLGLTGGFRTNSFPQAVVNPANGHLYVVYNDITGGADRANVYFRISTTGGATWGAAAVLNNDGTTRDQFFPTIAVTPDGSRVFASWYDRRSDPNNSRIERWGVIGTVSGAAVSWGPNFPISSGSFPPVVGQDPILIGSFMGDYDQAVADNRFFYVTWGDNRLSTGIHANQPDVRFAKIPVTGPGPILRFSSSSLATLDTAACNSFYVAIENVGGATARNVFARLSTTAPGVVIEEATASYPNIPVGAAGTNLTPFKVRFTSGFACASGIPFTLSVTTTRPPSRFQGPPLDAFTIPFTLGSTFGLGATTQIDNNTPIPIPDLAMTESQIELSGFSAAVGKVTVSLHLTHTFDADLSIFLVGPDGTTVELSTRNGGASDNYGTSCTPPSSRTTFDDAAATSITTGLAPFAGTFRPEGSLSAFNGKSGSGLNGTWRLRIVDEVGGDVGALHCWSLMIATATCTSGGRCSTDARRGSDFDGDGRSDITVFRPSTGTWFNLRSEADYSTSFSTVWGASGDIPVTGDYDGDGKTDLAVFRPSTGGWHIRHSSTNYTTTSSYTWGVSTDQPLMGDFDGDGKSDIAVFRPSANTWNILRSTTNYTTSISVPWGQAGDVTAPADFDGDGKTDPAVFRPSTGGWLILNSGTGYMTSSVHSWGASGDIPVPGDYDGDGRGDPAVFRPSTGQWRILKSTGGFSDSITQVLGISTDVPVPADYDGDGKHDLAVFRNGTWFIAGSASNYAVVDTVSWGAPGDIAVMHRP